MPQQHRFRVRRSQVGLDFDRRIENVQRCCARRTHQRSGQKMLSLPSKKLSGVLLAAAVGAGLAGASAATLGGITSQGLGADDQVVSTCDSDGMTSAYTTAYSATAQTYQVTVVTFSGVNAACNGKSVSLTLRNGTTSLGTTTAASITVAASSFSITLSSPIAATSINGLSLLITG